MSGSSRGERRLELGEALSRDSIANSIIAVDNDRVLLARLGVRDLGRNGNDLVDESAGLLRGGGLLERLGGKGVLHLTRDVILGRDVLACA